MSRMRSIPVLALCLFASTAGCANNPPPRPVPPPENVPELPPWYPEQAWNSRDRDERTFYMGKVVFDTGKHTIKPEAEVVLRQLLSWLQANPDISRVRLEGHTDARAGEEYNQALSERRALAVADWLVDNGLDHNRLLAVAFGETRPLYDNGTADGRAENRRTAFFPAEVAGRRFDDKDPTNGGLVLTVLSKEEREKAKEKGKVPKYEPPPVKNERNIFKPVERQKPQQKLEDRILTPDDDEGGVLIDEKTGQPTQDKVE